MIPNVAINPKGVRVSRVDFLFVRRYVSSPEIIPSKPQRMVAVPRSLSIAQLAVHRHPKAHTDPSCPSQQSATNTLPVHRSARDYVLTPGGAPSARWSY